MSEEREGLIRAYRRAGIGLAVGALVWTVVLLFGGGESERASWLIPVCAAALSVLCFSLYSKSKEK